MKKEEKIAKCSTHTRSLNTERNKSRKTAFDVAQEWMKLGKDKIRKMKLEESCNVVV